MSYHTFHKQRGFTLIELMAVMLIIVALSSIALEAVNEITFRNSYEVTKDRHEKIVKAIYGTSDGTRSFVSDVGRLPFALQELLNGGFCDDTTLFNSTTCTGTGTWTASTTGWNGPYIHTTQSFDKPNALADGWGHKSPSAGGNYGWNVIFYDSSDSITTVTNDIARMSIQSAGESNVLGFGDAYPSDPNIINVMWNVDISDGIALNIKTNRSFTSCDITNILDQPSCEAAGKYWEPVSGPCKLAPGGNSCDATWTDEWSGTQCLSTSRAYCDQYIGTVSDATKSIELKITHGGNTTITSTLPVLMTESGTSQRVLFKFSESTIPLGNHDVTIAYDGSNVGLGKMLFSPNSEIPTLSWQAP